MSKKYHSPNEYTTLGIISIPQGDHRVRICNVVEKKYGYTGIEGFEITLKVSGRRGLLWYYLICDPEDEVKTQKRFASFFNSFNIVDHDVSHYPNWIGKQGAVRVRHAVDEETGLIKAYVYYCLCGAQRDILPPFRDIALRSS